MRKRYKIPLSALVVFFAAIVATVIIVAKTNVLERKVNELLKYALEHKYDLKITLGEIGGSIFSGFNISNIEVSYGPEESRRPLASIGYLEVDYDLSDLWHRRWILQSLFADSLRVHLTRLSDGSISLPKFGGNGEGGNGKSLDFAVKSLILTNASLSIEHDSTTDLLDKLSLFCSVAKSGGRFQLDIDTCRFSAQDIGVTTVSISGDAAFVDSMLSLADMAVSVDSSSLSFDAEVKVAGKQRFMVSVDSSHINLTELSKLAGPELTGDVAVSGVVGGTMDSIVGDLLLSGRFLDWRIGDLAVGFGYSSGVVSFRSLKGEMFGGLLDGTGRLDFTTKPESYEYSGSISDFNLNDAVNETFESELSGQMRLRGQSFRQASLLLDLEVRLGRGKFDAYSFDSITGRCLVTVDSILFSYPFSLRYRSTFASVGGKLEYEGIVDLDGIADLPVIDEFKGQIFLEDIAGRGNAEFTLAGPTEDPDLVGAFESDSVRIYDLTSTDFTADLDIHRVFSEPEGFVRLASGSFEYSDIAGDSLSALLFVAGDSTWIDSARIATASTVVTGSGKLISTPDSMLLILNAGQMTLDSQTISLDDDGVLSFVDSGVTIHSLELTSGLDHLTARGVYSYDGAIDFDLKGDSLNVESWLQRLEDDYDVSGQLSMQGQLGGTLLNPAFSFDFGVPNLMYGGETFGKLDGSVSFDDSLLTIENASLTGLSNTAKVVGYYPVDLALESRESRTLVGKPFEIRVNASGTDFGLLDLAFEDVEWFTGRFGIEVVSSGLTGSPNLEGTMTIDDGQCKLFYIEDLLRDISFRGRFDGKELSVDTLAGTLSRGKTTGSFSVKGSVDLQRLSSPVYDLSATGSNLPVKYDLGEIEMLIGNLDLEVQGEHPPVVSGDIDLVHFLYEEPFYEDVQLEAIAAADTAESFDYNIHISAPQNMWIKNEDADVELQGDLILLKEGKLENFLGSLQTIRGKFYLTSFNRTFAVLPGGTIEFDDITEFNPNLDISMTTTVRDSSGVRDVCMQLTRTLRDPNIDVCAGSDLSIDEVWVLMNPIGSGFVGSEPSDTLNGGPSSLGDRLTVGATGVAAGQVSRYVSRRLGVETFEISAPTVGKNFNPLETELTIGFYTTPRLYIYGSSRLTLGGSQELGFEYRLSNRVFFSGNRDRDNLYHLNLNLNWDLK